MLELILIEETENVFIIRLNQAIISNKSPSGEFLQDCLLEHLAVMTRPDVLFLDNCSSSLNSRTNSSTIISWLHLERSGFFPFLFRVLVQPLTNPLHMLMIRTRSRVIYRCLFSWLIISTTLPSSRSEQSLLMNMIMKRNILPTTSCRHRIFQIVIK